MILRIIKNLHIFQTRWKTLVFMVINYIRELIVEKLDDNGIHSTTGSILYVDFTGIRTDDACFAGEIHTL